MTSARPWYWPEEGQPHRTEPFTWIVRGEIAASWWPDPSVLETYRREGIKAIVNCSEFDNRADVAAEFAYYHFRVDDFGTPTEDQVRRFIDVTLEHRSNNEPVVVHCVAGCGRTAQFIVAWGACHGYITRTTDPVQWIREKRSCSLETREQMSHARKLARLFWG
jgi:atypical dual specificity phosphatase